MNILLLILNIILVLFNSYIYYKLCLLNDEIEELYNTCYTYISKEFKLEDF